MSEEVIEYVLDERGRSLGQGLKEYRSIVEGEALQSKWKKGFFINLLKSTRRLREDGTWLVSLNVEYVPVFSYVSLNNKNTVDPDDGLIWADLLDDTGFRDAAKFIRDYIENRKG